MKLRSSCLAVESTKVSIQGRVAIFWARPVEIREIDAHSPLPISLLDHGYDRQLVEVVYFSNEISFLTSSAIALSRSCANTCFFCRTGEDARFTFSL